MHANTEKTGSAPRHAGPPRPLLSALNEAREIILEWADKPMSGPACVLCGLMMGLLFVPMILYCYFG